MMDTVPIWYKYHVGPLMHVSDKTKLKAETGWGGRGCTETNGSELRTFKLILDAWKTLHKRNPISTSLRSFLPSNKKVGGAFCDLSNALAQVAKRKQLGSKRFIGLFYDDSRKVSPEQLRWVIRFAKGFSRTTKVGSFHPCRWVIGVWETDLIPFNNNPIDKKQIAALEAEGYKRYELEVCMRTYFSYVLAALDTTTKKQQ
eukprot:jgi/Bigna1/137470/aug1.39_g12178